MWVPVQTASGGIHGTVTYFMNTALLSETKLYTNFYVGTEELGILLTIY